MSDEVTPRPAATVLLLRDGPEGVEAYFLRRPARSSFAASAYVFPGGALDAEDSAAELLALAPGFEARTAAPRMRLDGDDDGVRRSAGLHVAAVREVFEETGILLGTRADGATLGDADADELGAARRALLGGEAFVSVLREHGLRIAPEVLTYVAHFITPEGEKRRYDTRFFACPAPLDQEPAHHAAEATESGWYTATEALHMTEASFALMLPPTRIMCHEIARHATAGEAITDLGARDVEAILFTVDDVISGRMPASLPAAWPPPRTLEQA